MHGPAPDRTTQQNRWTHVEIERGRQEDRQGREEVRSSRHCAIPWACWLIEAMSRFNGLRHFPSLDINRNKKIDRPLSRI